jgi:hypothetical protein
MERDNGSVSRRGWGYVAFSVVVLVPCFWHARIQAGDLGSHIYNAWLAQLIESGHAPGLAIRAQATNVLFDCLLKTLLDAFGAEAAQRASVSLAVLVFVWGAYAFICRVSGGRPLHLLPIVAMLAYGWVFRMGLFNFYLSLGLCLVALSLAWAGRVRGLIVATPILALAYVAHALPVAWVLAVLGYRSLAAPLNARQRMLLLGGGIAAIVVISVVMQSIWTTFWFPQQFAAVCAVDQLLIYDNKYFLVATGLLFCWSRLVAGWMRTKGVVNVLSDVPFQICVLTGAGILILPDWIRIPGYQHAFVFQAERMSLVLGMCVCALIGGAEARSSVRWAIPAVALLFFAFTYADESALNSLEDRMEDLVERLPHGQRVVSAVSAVGLSTNPTTHMIDRVCVGRCYSYGNYEPASGAFRIRVVGDTPLVVASNRDATRLERGDYVVKERDLPLFQVVAGPNGLETRELSAGQISGITAWEPR